MVVNTLTLMASQTRLVSSSMQASITSLVLLYTIYMFCLQMCFAQRQSRDRGNEPDTVRECLYGALIHYHHLVWLELPTNQPFQPQPTHHLPNRKFAFVSFQISVTGFPHLSFFPPGNPYLPSCLKSPVPAHDARLRPADFHKISYAATN